MGRPRLTYRCRECGKPCPRRGRTQGGISCVECAIKRRERSNWQIHEGQGEYYDKWLAGMGAAVLRLQQQTILDRARVSESPEE